MPPVCRSDHHQLSTQYLQSSSTHVRNIRQELQQYKLTVTCEHGSDVSNNTSVRYYGSAAPVLLQAPSRDRVESDSIVWLNFLAAAKARGTGTPFSLTALSLYEADDDDERADDDDDMVESLALPFSSLDTLSSYGMYSQMVRLPDDLPTGDYELKVELTMTDASAPTDYSTVELVTKFPYISMELGEAEVCDTVSIGAHLAIASYESRSTQVRRLSGSTWTDADIDDILRLNIVDTMDHCMRPAGRIESLEWTQITSMSRNQFHFSVHATPDLASFLSQPDRQDDFVRFVNGHDMMSISLSFRGTATSADMVTNALAFGVPCEKVFPASACDMTGVQVGDDDDDDEGHTPEAHGGFMFEYGVVRAAVQRILVTLQRIEEQIEAGADELPDRVTLPLTINLLISGHSQGGALAQLALFDAAAVFNQVRVEPSRFLRVVVAGVTLASPMVADGAFARLFHSRLPRSQLVRVEAEADVVPELPPVGYTPMGTVYDVPCETEWLRIDTIRCHSATRYGEQIFKETAPRPASLDLPIYFADQEETGSYRQVEEDGDGTTSLVLPIVAASVGALCCCALLAAAAMVAVATERRRRKPLEAATLANISQHGEPGTRRSRAHSRVSRSRSRSNMTRIPQS